MCYREFQSLASQWLLKNTFTRHKTSLLCWATGPKASSSEEASYFIKEKKKKDTKPETWVGFGEFSPILASLAPFPAVVFDS